MGGLQRSGTTWLETLVTSSRMVSSLSFDNVDPNTYWQRRPWKLQNHTQEYFEGVVRSGGIEGKFIQSVYPYTYLVRDVGINGKSLESLLLDVRTASPQAAAQLYSQWSLFWDTSKLVLLEKTPENLVMGPFLQSSFGASATRFAFVMRHPLVWALAIEKWIFHDFTALRTVEERVDFWFGVMSRATEQLPQLRDVIVLQLETAGASPDLQLGVSRHLLCSAGNTPDAARAINQLTRPAIDSGSSREILASSMAYVSCWLSGMEFKSSARRCMPRKPSREPGYRQQTEQLAQENRLRLRELARRRESQANRFGYTFKAFRELAQLQTDALLRTRIFAPGGKPAALAAKLGAVPNTSLVRAALRPHLVVLPPSSPPDSLEPRAAAPKRAAPSDGKHVILAFHKMGADRERPSGMDIRMSQIVGSLISMQYTVHYVCHCDVHPSQLNPFQPGVVIYTGTMKEQFDQAVAAATPLHSVLIFFTTLTMSVHQRLLQGQSDWYLEPKTKLPEEMILSWVRGTKNLQSVCTTAFADDIHYIRAVEVMARHDAAKARMASDWIKQRELGFHSAVDSTATVSLEDAEALQRALAGGDYARNGGASRCTKGCSCSMTWVPYIQVVRSEKTMQPFQQRQEGMLYVGGMHGLAVIAMEWMLSKVQPFISGQSVRGDKELLKGGMGHLHLAGPGWSQHAAENPTLNRSVAMGFVSVLGTLSDLQLEQRLQDHKVFVAPVLNGTGIATKNVLAMAHGIPLVTTLTGLNGLGLPAEQQAILVADDPSRFAEHVVRVQTSQGIFDQTWRAALQHTKRYLSADRQRAQLCRMIGCVAESFADDALTPRHASQDNPAEALCPLTGSSPSPPLLYRASELGIPLPPAPPPPPQPPPQMPLMVLGAHGIEGGSTVLSKLLSNACRSSLTPKLGLRCIFREGDQSCEPDKADVCFHKDTRFSAGRLAARGYRFVHLVRAPIDVLTRSFLLADPNATHTIKNATLLVDSLELHWKKLSGGLLHDMQDFFEGTSADPRSMSIRYEDLASDEHGNETLGRLFSHLLLPGDAEQRAPMSQVQGLAQELALESARILPSLIRSDQQGESQRKHLQRLLLRKPAKCQHVNKLHKALGYPQVTCTEPASNGNKPSIDARL